MVAATSPDSFTFTVGKLDAGMAILLGERAHLIEFPSILLPPGATTGSIVNIAVHQNHEEEKKRDAEFWQLQNDILHQFGVETPEAPKLTLRNITQTSVTLEWPPIKLASAKLRSLDIYRNSERLAYIPSPLTNTSTKVSGLEISHPYTFQLILRTTAGTFPSNVLKVKTHAMSDTSGICVCFGNVQDDVLLENAKMALKEMGGKWSEKIQIDTTHFVCTTAAPTPSGAQAVGNGTTAPGVEYQRALQLSIPVVQPHWILACHSEQKMVSIASYYLGATPATPLASASFNQQQRPQSMSHPASRSPSNNNTNNTNNRASMPAPARHVPPAISVSTPTSSFVGQTSAASSTNPAFEPTPEEEDAEHQQQQRPASANEKRKSRTGTMNKDFKFPPPVANSQEEEEGKRVGGGAVSPASIEVPPPPPVEKERGGQEDSEAEDEVGDTVDIPLN